MMLLINVPVEEYTTPDPVTAREDMSIVELKQMMDELGVRHLPVLRGDEVVGIVSERDVRLASGLSSAEKTQILTSDIMTPAPLTVGASTSLDHVAYLMSDKKVGSVIVNDDGGRFLGIFTASDALNALIEIIRTGGRLEE